MAAQEARVPTAAAHRADPATQPEMITVTEGFYRWSDIVWLWPNSLDAYQRNGVLSLLHPKSLVCSDHPLVESGNQSVELYQCDMDDGATLLCFSLKQILYIQEWVYRMRLAEPAWLDYLIALDSRKDGETIEPPPPNDTIKPVVLPSTFLPASFFVKVTPIQFASPGDIKKLDATLRKQKRRLRSTMIPCAPESEEISIASTPIAADQDSACSTPSINGLGPTASAAVLATEDPAAMMPSSDAGMNDALTSIGGKIMDALDEADTGPAAYFSLAQQAVLVASAGGVLSVFRDAEARKKAEAAAGKQGTPETPGPSELPETPSSDSDEEEVAPEALGRILFVAFEMNMRSHEDDKDIVDTGYAAVWFQENPEAADDADGTGSRADRMEEGREYGHFITQEHVGTGLVSSGSAFSATLPVPRAKLEQTLRRKLFDLWKKAGSGPIYVIVHSVDRDFRDFAALGLDVNTWDTALDAADRDLPSYSRADAIGRRFVVDTARLFGAVEVGEHARTGPDGRTTRSALAAYDVLFGDPQAPEPLDMANAGNAAANTLDLFYALVTGPSLDEARTTFNMRANLMRVLELTKGMGLGGGSGHDSDDDDDDDDDDDSLGGIGAPGRASESDYDSDFDGIGGAFYADGDHLVPIDDGDWGSGSD